MFPKTTRVRSACRVGFTIGTGDDAFLVKVRGRLQEAEAIATDLMAEFAELDLDFHVQVKVFVNTGV